MIELKEAIRKAKTFVAEAFADESASSVRLEEIDFDDVREAWTVTIGLLRPEVTSRRSGLGSVFAEVPLTRTFKTVVVDADGKVRPSIKMRMVHPE